MIEPKVLLLDEPLSNLDAKLRKEMQLELHALQRRLGITALYVTHDQEEALTLSDRIAIMESGRVSQCSGPNDIYRSPANRFVAELLSGLISSRAASSDGIMSSFAPRKAVSRSWCRNTCFPLSTRNERSALCCVPRAFSLILEARCATTGFEPTKPFCR